MLKKLLSLCLLAPLNLLAQLPSEIAYDSLQYSADKSLVLIFSKETYSLYSVKNKKYLFQADKLPIFYLPFSNSFLRIDDQDKACIYINQKSEWIFAQGTLDFAIGLSAEPDQSGHNAYIQNLKIETKSKSLLLSPETYYQHLDLNLTCKKINEDLFLIEDFQCEIDPQRMQNNYNGVSRIYSRSKKTWVSSTEYIAGDCVRDFLFMYKRIPDNRFISDTMKFEEYLFVADVYRIDGSNLVLLKSNVGSLKELQFENLFSGPNESYSEATIFEEAFWGESSKRYIHKVGNKYGFVSFAFDPAYLHTSYEQIFHPEHNMIFQFSDNILGAIDSEYDTLVYYNMERNNETIKGTSHIGIYLDDENRMRSHLIDTVFYSYDESNENLVKKSIDELDRNNYEMRIAEMLVVRDSLVVVNNYYSSDQPEYAQPVRTMSGDDSISDDGYLLFWEPVAWSKSGVYNMQSEQWIIPDTCGLVLPTQQGILIANFRIVYDTKYSLKRETEYSFVDYNGNLILKNKSYIELLEHPELFKYLILSYPADSIFSAPYGPFYHQLMPEKAGNKDVFLVSGEMIYPDPLYGQYYSLSGNKIGIYAVTKSEDLMFSNMEIEPHEFIHRNHFFNFSFWLENDSLFLDNGVDVMSVSKEGGKIVYEPQIDLRSEGNTFYACSLIQNGDTTVKSTLPNYDFIKTYASIEIANGFLVVNDMTVSTIVYGNNYYSNENATVCDFESENSSIWIKQNEMWVQQLTGYADIIPVNNGFIVRSGNYSQKTVHAGEGNNYYWFNDGFDLIDVPSRYSLVDYKMQKIHYKDSSSFVYIKDLGFGYEIKLDNGNLLFMTYDFRPVTESDWDKFVYVNGKILASKGGYPILDSEGSEIIDPDGNILYKTYYEEYFELPK
ncbi:MAG: hypothetical protein JNJ99_06405 [Crocinitomicaceae bacterium]|nr:hypothetical protein [Crocinitomicaceae bacterium]